MTTFTTISKEEDDSRPIADRWNPSFSVVDGVKK
jgi:hypothetical protein